ncbi:MAG: alpha-isopropylmalate synthase regulatory domain-containing protein, partial [Candidatus Jacksonbacteria bacterium]
NQARIGLTDQSGKSNITAKAREFNIKLTEEELASIAVRYQKLINNGANFGQADASFYLFLMRELGRLPKFFDVHALNVMIEKIKGFAITSTANLHLKINGKAKTNKTCGVGPVHAMDAALRLSLKDKLPSIKQVRLIDFKVRDVESHHGSAAKVRVVISFSDKQLHWSTMAVHQNIIIASWKALLDGYIYKMSHATSPTLLPSPLIH